MSQPISIQDLRSNLTDDFDLFICSSSFEERCFTIPKEVNKAFLNKISLVFYNENEYEEIITNANKLVETLSAESKKITLNTNNPIQNAIEINNVLEGMLEAGSVRKILLDTTTFTHETLLIILRLLYLKKDKYQELYSVYVGAKDYATTESEKAKKWLSSGISSIRTVVGYPGVLSPARNNHLIVLFGFESDRTRNLIEELQFDTISLGFGAEGKSIDQTLQEINYERHCDLKNAYRNAHDFQLSLIDPLETKNDILKQISLFPNYNTVIAPMNNKISTIGAALVAIENPKVQLIYAKPIEYNVADYSKSREDCYLHKIGW